jgi:S1-C subfamily serine protease
MNSSKYFLLILVLTANLIGKLYAKPEVEDIQRAKNATVLVETSGGDKGYGSAFCIDNIGIYVTNAHIVKSKGVGGIVDLILRPGGSDQAKIKAKVVKIDEKNDLAILIAQEKATHVKLELGNSEELIETTTVVGYGYPFGKELAINKDSYPSISVNMGRVTAIRKSAGIIDLIQLDVTLNPGNSGGPIVEEKGKVVGIVVSGIVGAGGVNFAIPVDKLKKLLVEPIVDVILPSVKYEDRFKPAKFSALVFSFIKNVEDKYMVTLNLTTNAKGMKTTLPLTSLDSKLFEGMITPLKASSEKLIKVVAVYPNGEVEGITVLKTFTAKATPYTLDLIKEIETLPKIGDKDQFKLNFKDGKTIDDDLKTLKSIDIDLGNKVTHIAELKNTEKLIFQENETADETISYEIVVKNGEKEIARSKGIFNFLGVPAISVSKTRNQILQN